MTRRDIEADLRVTQEEIAGAAFGVRDTSRILANRLELIADERRRLAALAKADQIMGVAEAALTASQAEVERLRRERDAYGEIGDRDGYERAIQDVDLLTGGDGEYRASTIADRDCRDPEAMKARIAGRWAAAEARATRAEGLLAEAGEVLGQAHGMLRDYVHAAGPADAHDTAILGKCCTFLAKLKEQG